MSFDHLRVHRPNGGVLPLVSARLTVSVAAHPPAQGRREHADRGHVGALAEFVATGKVSSPTISAPRKVRQANVESELHRARFGADGGRHLGLTGRVSWLPET